MDEGNVYIDDLKDDNDKKKKYLGNKKKIVIGCVIFVAIFLFSSLFYIFLVPKLNLNGNSYMKIEYGNFYSEPGYSAKYLGDDITDKVWVVGNVDSSRPGVYNLKYKVRKNKIVVTKTRKVEIVDSVAPVLTLNGNDTIDVCPNKEYEEEGYIALDNYDGDLSSKVDVDINDAEIVYTVKDSSNNVTSLKRKINKVDKDNPVITLKSGENYYVMVNTSYVEPGYSAIDNCDGDLTSNVSVSGDVDINTPGKYNITYTVSDSKGNTSTVIRVVTVATEPVTSPSIKGTIYLTFDDGPSKTITPQLLDILKEKDVKATFFVINHSSSLDYLIKREYDEGHTVALHSMTHSYPTIYSSVDAYFNDLEAISDKVERLTGHKSMIIRFPGGSSNTVSRNYSRGIMKTLTNEVLNRGYHYFDWNVSSGDAGGSNTSDEVYRSVVNNLSKNRANIVLLHDFESNYKTLNAISDIIDYGKANGYEFLAIDMTTAMVRHSVNN